MYSRTLNGTPLTLKPSGWTYRATFVLLDRETRSLWFPEDGDLLGIQGPSRGKRLPGLIFSNTSWGQWVREHPESSILP